MMNPLKTPAQKQAFTLVELLVVLLAIGIISSIAVPKVLSAGRQTQQRTQLQVVLDTLDTHFYDEHLKGNQFLPVAQRWVSLQDKLQTRQTCGLGVGNLLDCLPQGVLDNSLVGGGAVQLNNNMIIYGILSTPDSTTDDFYVDINGDEGPNLGGQGGSTTAALANDCNDRFRFNINHVTGEVTPIECTVDLFND